MSNIELAINHLLNRTSSDSLINLRIYHVQALDMIRSRSIQAIMETNLEGKYSIEEATTLVDLASKCLQYEPRDRPDIKKLVSILQPLQTKSEVLTLLLLIFCLSWRYGYK